jgi:hypothetical protein
MKIRLIIFLVSSVLENSLITIDTHSTVVTFILTVIHLPIVAFSSHLVVTNLNRLLNNKEDGECTLLFC